MTQIDPAGAGNLPELTRNKANHAPLTPLDFLLRTAQVYPERTAVIHGQQRTTWAET